jgi:hypothetical protein
VLPWVVVGEVARGRHCNRWDDLGHAELGQTARAQSPFECVEEICSVSPGLGHCITPLGHVGRTWAYVCILLNAIGLWLR